MSCIVESSLSSISNNNDYKEKKNVTFIELLVSSAINKSGLKKKNETNSQPLVYTMQLKLSMISNFGILLK